MINITLFLDTYSYKLFNRPEHDVKLLISNCYLIMIQFSSKIEYKILTKDEWQCRSVFFATSNQLYNWLSDDWVKMANSKPALIVSVAIDQPVDYPDIDPEDVIGYEDPTGDLYFFLDIKQEHVNYKPVDCCFNAR